MTRIKGVSHPANEETQDPKYENRGGLERPLNARNGVLSR